MHLSRLPSGRWRVAVKANGHRRTATADTKQGAQREGARLLLAMGGTTGAGATVADLLALAVTEGHWSATYTADVLAVVDRLPVTFMSRTAASVSPNVINSLYHHLAADGWTAFRIRRVHEVLSAAWGRAVKLERVDSNPCQKVDKPAVSRRPITVPTHQQAKALMAAPGHPTERLALRLAGTLGARRGELVALQWQDVDLERASVTIRRSLSYTPASGVVPGDTKTGETGHRVLAVAATTSRALARVRATQARNALAAGLTPVWVLSDDAGVSPWRPDRLTHIFAAARRASGVAGVRLNDLRHYVATTMLQDGVAPLDVAYQLGHTTLATTLSVYAHFLPGRGRESADRLAARLDG